MSRKKSMTSKKMTAEEYHRRFADRIIEQIKRGVAPWQKPWKPGERVLPRNLHTNRPYAGGNSLHLAVVAEERGYSDTRWGTYRQIQLHGGHVRKGERGTRILSYQDHRRVAVKDPQGRPVTDENNRQVYRYERLSKPWIKRYTVFNAEQANRLPTRPEPAEKAIWDAHLEADKVLKECGVDIRHVEGDRAYYRLKTDDIVLPKWEQFPSANHYYQTALHEVGHATGHPKRMNRESLIQGVEAGFGSQIYAREELRAEISAMMTGERIGIGHDPSRGAAYVESWVAVLEKDPREIRRAAADAQRISNYILERGRQREAEREPEAAKSASSPVPTVPARQPENSRSVTAAVQQTRAVPIPSRSISPSR